MPKTNSINLSKNKLSNEPPVPRKRRSLTAIQKREICLKKKSSPFLKNKDLVKEYDSLNFAYNEYNMYYI